MSNFTVMSFFLELNLAACLPREHISHKFLCTPMDLPGEWIQIVLPTLPDLGVEYFPSFPCVSLIDFRNLSNFTFKDGNLGIYGLGLGIGNVGNWMPGDFYGWFLLVA